MKWFAKQARATGEAGAADAPAASAAPAASRTTSVLGGGSMRDRPWCGAHPCSHVFTLGTAHVWAGAYSSVLDDARDWRLLLCCAGPEFKPDPALAWSPSAERLVTAAGLRAHAPWIAIHWDDGATPLLTPDDWNRLTAMIGALAGDVGVYCQGGHGRTGTALAILAALADLVPQGGDPVTWVRSKYCGDAVETARQCRYVERITGRRVTAETHSWNDYASYGTDGRARDWERAPSNVRVYRPPVGAKDASPITNAAGDIVGWDYRYSATTPATGAKAPGGSAVPSPAPAPQAFPKANEYPWTKWTTNPQENQR